MKKKRVGFVVILLLVVATFPLTANISYFHIENHVIIGDVKIMEIR